VLESKHVIGLFLLMLLFSGVFFSLGYVMGRNQYDGQVRASASWLGRADSDVQPKPVAPAKKSPAAEPSTGGNESEPATPTPPEWDFYKNDKPAKTAAHLEPEAKPADTSASSRPVSSKTAIQPVSAPVKSAKPVAPAPQAANGTYILQVAALQKQDDALTVASSLQKKHYLCYVQPPQKDKYYRVQVGPFKDRKSADIAKQGLENEGFKAFYVKH